MTGPSVCRSHLRRVRSFSCHGSPIRPLGGVFRSAEATLVGRRFVLALSAGLVGGAFRVRRRRNRRGIVAFSQSTESDSRRTVISYRLCGRSACITTTDATDQCKKSSPTGTLTSSSEQPPSTIHTVIRPSQRAPSPIGPAHLA